MKKMTFLACAFLLLAYFSLQAQTADEVMNKHLEARGGVQKLKAIKSVIIEAVIKYNGIEVPTKIYAVHGKSFKVELNVMGTTGYRIVTPTAGWVFFPFQGHKKPEPLTKEQLATAQGALDIQDLVDYKVKGYKAEYKGKKEVDGRSCYVILLTKGKEKPATYYFDDKYYLYKTEEIITINGEDKEKETIYHEYKKTADQILYPSSYSNMDGDTKVSKYQVNAKIDDAVFKPGT